MMPAVAILAGGRATRLGPLAKTVPKSLMEVAGKPFLFHQFDLLQKAGVPRVVICTGHLADRIAAAIPAERPWTFEIDFSLDGPTLLGTGGAIRQALPKLSDPFFVLYGDSYLPIPLPPVAAAFPPEAAALMTVFRNENRWDRSNVLFEEGKIKIYDKRTPTAEMRHIDYGLSLFRQEAFSGGPATGAFDLADLFTTLSREGRLAGFETGERFYEIGSPDGLEELRRRLAHELLDEGMKGDNMDHQTYIDQYFQGAKTIIDRLDRGAVAKLLQHLLDLRARGGRLFLLGVGGSAANASHAVNDFRKLAGIEAYTPTDNVSELTARTNDEGWETVFVEWLKVSRMTAKDAVFVLSVGGGDLEKKISVNLVRALDHAKAVGAMRLGIVGRAGGYTAKTADACVIVPPVEPEMVTPHTEAFQAVVWHLLVSHPALKQNEMKWESTKGGKA